jgi:integrase/recombinase XerD
MQINIDRLKARKFRKFTGVIPEVADKPERKGIVRFKRTKRSKKVSITKAKTLNQEQFDRVIREALSEDYGLMKSAIFHLSFYCGLRVQEIAGLNWKRNILNVESQIGDEIHITKDIGKKTTERFLPLPAPAKHALQAWRDAQGKRARWVVSPMYKASEVSRVETHEGHMDPNTLAQWMRRFYQKVGFNGCTSHSGRRTAITSWARNCNLKGGSIHDVKNLAGHSSVTTTDGYIETTPRMAEISASVFS